LLLPSTSAVSLARRAFSRTRNPQLTNPPERSGLGGTDEQRAALAEPENLIHTIFEGTSEIQQLAISRAISGLRIQ
jgi:hypothetical protein